MVAFVQTRSGVNVFLNGEAHAIGKDHPNYSTIMEKCLNTDSLPADIEGLLDVSKAVETFTEGRITVQNEILKFDGVEMDPGLGARVIGLLREGQPIDSLVKFMDNLLQNPSFRAVNELYGFLAACNLPITSDGMFLAYKKVKSTYFDIYSGTMSNSLGSLVAMPRNRVDEDSQRTCSEGLHCCSFGYLGHYGNVGTKDADDRVVIVKVNPKDVVAVPADYNNQKMRVCEYLVIDEIPNDGISEIMNYCYGDRNEGWIRDTLGSLRTLLQDSLGIEQVRYDEDLLSPKVSMAKLTQIIDDVIGQFELDTDSEAYFERYMDVLTLKDLLQFVSNWSI